MHAVKSVGSSRAGGCAGSSYPFLTRKERDVETGLDYFLARYYSSTQGRFTSPDEFKGGPEELFEDVDPHDPLFYADASEPQSLNKYHYALGNPLRYVDPDGHQATLADRLKQGAASVGRTVMNTIEGAASAYAEDNGVGGTSGPQNKVGRAIGHGLALAQGFGEAYIGLQGMAGGGAEAIATAPACASGVGCAAPTVGIATTATSAVVATHGTLVIGNTLNNIFSKNGGPKAAESPGQTAAGRATDANGRPLGPSGKPSIHQVDSPTKKAAKDAARNAGQGAPMQHPTPRRGEPHFHPTDRKGKKIPDGTHYNYPL